MVERKENHTKNLKKIKQIPAFRDYFNNLPIEERILAGTYIGIFVSDSREELENLVTLIIINEQEKDIEISSIYFGGGTPSLVQSQTLESIIHYLNKKSYLHYPYPEISIEANPNVRVNNNKVIIIERILV